MLLAIGEAQAKWSVVTLKGQDVPNGMQALVLMENNVHTKHGSFSTGLVTNTVTDNSIFPSKTPDAMVEEVRQVMKSPAWTKNVVEGLHIYSLHWKEKNRYFRVIIKKDDKYTRVSFANLRIPYAMMESIEADILQRAFMGFEYTPKSKAKTVKMWPWIWNQMVSEAQAAALSMADLGEAYQGLMANLNQISSNLGVNSAREMAGAIHAARADAVAIGNQARVAVDGLSGEVRNLSNTVKEVTSFASGAKFGAGFQTGVFLTNALLNAGKDGMAWVLREAYYFFTKQMKPEERAAVEARAGDAFKKWGELSEKLLAAERELTTYQLAFAGAFLTPASIAIKTAEDAKVLKIDLEDQLAKLKKKLSETEGADARRACIQSIREKEKELNYAKFMEQVLTEVGSKDAMCRKLENSLDQWKLAELQMSRAKRIIASEIPTLLNSVKKDEVNALKDPAKFETRITECETDNKRLISQFEDQSEQVKCHRNPSSECASLAKDIKELKDNINTCRVDYEKAKSLVTAKSLGQAARDTNEQLSIFRKHLDHIVAADCEEGETGGACKGKQGDLAAIRSVHDKNVSKIREQCPNIKAGALASVEKQHHQEGVIDTNQNFEVQNQVQSKTPAQREPSSEKSDHFVARFGKWLSSGFTNGGSSYTPPPEQQAP